MAEIRGQSAAARVYARAMLRLAERGGAAESLLEEMEALQGLAGRSPALARFLRDPFVDAQMRRQLIETAFRERASDLFVDSLQVISRKGRLDLFASIVAAYREEYQDLRGIQEVRVTTAVPLSEPLRRRLAAAVERLTGKRVRLLETVAAGLIGGMVARSGDAKMDCSLAADLRKIEARLLDRASREIHWGRAVAAD